MIEPVIPVPTCEAEVTAEWLQEAIPAAVVPPLESARIGEGYGLSSEIHHFRWRGGPAVGRRGGPR